MENIITTILLVSNTLGLDIKPNSIVTSELLLSVCKVESGLNNIHNHNDAGSTSWGPCQVKAVAAKQVGVDARLLKHESEYYSPYVAALYLQYQEVKCRKFWTEKQDVLKCTLKAYNTGIVVKYRSSLENNPYAKKVLDVYNKR